MTAYDTADDRSLGRRIPPGRLMNAAYGQTIATSSITTQSDPDWLTAPVPAKLTDHPMVAVPPQKAQASTAWRSGQSLGRYATDSGTCSPTIRSTGAQDGVDRPLDHSRIARECDGGVDDLDEFVEPRVVSFPRSWPRWVGIVAVTDTRTGEITVSGTSIAHLGAVHVLLARVRLGCAGVGTRTRTRTCTRDQATGPARG